MILKPFYINFDGFERFWGHFISILMDFDDFGVILYQIWPKISILKRFSTNFKPKMKILNFCQNFWIFFFSLWNRSLGPLGPPGSPHINKPIRKIGDPALGAPGTLGIDSRAPKRNSKILKKVFFFIFGFKFVENRFKIDIFG